MNQNTPSLSASLLLSCMHACGNSTAITALPYYQHLEAGLPDAILQEAERFAVEKLLPINPIGDRDMAQWNANTVTLPAPFGDAYHDFVQMGWNAMIHPLDDGGQQLPWCLGSLINLLWNHANMGFALCPMLTQGAAELLAHYGSDALKQYYLPHLISGKWTGTMCLTEPQAGSDVGAVSTKATPENDAYRIHGTKIFITYGEHSLTENIVHMVLARLPDAPTGTKGISLFLVPKILPDGSRNEVSCLSIEHKLGIHASPTCVMEFGGNAGALGYLIGEENQGMKAMFMMMNNARLNVGIEGAGIAWRATQMAQNYAQERTQFGTPIATFPDVGRTLNSMHAHAVGMACMVSYAGSLVDLATHATTEDARTMAAAHLGIVVPIVKSYCTETGFLMTSDAMQLFGGMGYIEETGIAQLMRDSRIAMIYEGTNGIQALDLLQRKIQRDNGKALQSWLASFNDVDVPEEIHITVKTLLHHKAASTSIIAHDVLMLLGTWLENAMLQRLAQHMPEHKALHTWHSDYICPAILTHQARIHRLIATPK